MFFEVDKMVTKSLVVLGCLIATGLAAKFPKNWVACKNDNNLNSCLKESIQSALADLVRGMPSLGILPLDPLHFDAITIDQGQGPVAIKLEFSDLDTTGLNKMSIDAVNTDWKTMKVYTTTPKVTLKGNYKMGGKVLLLPIKGEGTSELILDNFKANITIHYEDKESGSKMYYSIEKLGFEFDVDRLQMQFDNLFNGDKALGDNMNKFLNENWNEILNELKPNVAATFSAAFKEIGNRLFSKITKTQITPS